MANLMSHPPLLHASLTTGSSVVRCPGAVSCLAYGVRRAQNHFTLMSGMTSSISFRLYVFLFTTHTVSIVPATRFLLFPHYHSLLREKVNADLPRELAMALNVVGRPRNLIFVMWDLCCTLWVVGRSSP